ncbi:uncharacterized protein LAJ45_10210 [Morchella importuna]|uniref:uncharacterized protein n=1 Tax=Morchella importuna TaxID=1174673 RepID=UPI001E8D755C|nr:uncharacterized protein LAJ45_10210 [Morchella importuna]KAH8145733.1 hypothetical protein LAJ45_10210 [Morchella importuna]
MLRLGSLRIRPFATRLPRLPSIATITYGQRALLASVQYSNKLSDTWFDSSQPRKDLGGSDADGKKPVDERTLNLGKTIRVLQERMPTLLQSPLPSEILSPHVSLVLFPTTHPNLPTVRGRLAYIAALWTSPVAWGRLPSRDLRLHVLSERMLNGERLVVKWRTTDVGGDDTVGVRGGTTAVEQGGFCGIFIFEFDEKGRILTHTIENAEEGLGGEQPGGFITVTEWLLGKAKGRTEGGGLAWQCERR